MKNNNKFLIQATCIFISLMMLTGCADGPNRDNELSQQRLFVTHSELDMIEGDEVQITASPSNQTFTWTSSNPAIATVTSDGLVTAVTDGICIINVVSSEGLTREIPVNVVEYVPLEGFQVINAHNLQAPENMSMILSQILSLGANPVPVDYNERFNFRVIYESLNPEIIEIDENGIISGVNFGLATVRVTIQGKDFDPVLVPINVVEDPITKIVVPEDLSLRLDEVITLTHSFEPLNYSVIDNSIMWVSNSPNIAVNDGVIEVLDPGNGSVTVSWVTDPSVFTEIFIEVLAEVNVVDFAEFTDDRPADERIQIATSGDVRTFPGDKLSDATNFATNPNPPSFGNMYMVYKKVDFIYGGVTELLGIDPSDIPMAYNRDFFTYNPEKNRLVFTGETGEWDVYYSDKYNFIWIRRDHENYPDAAWARGVGFTQATAWHADFDIRGSGGVCWGLQKLRHAAYMKRIADGVFQAHIHTRPTGIQWMNAVTNLCGWTQPMGSSWTLIAPPGFTGAGNDIGCSADVHGYYRVTYDFNTNTRIIERVDLD